jgi:hypothetical protein
MRRLAGSCVRHSLRVSPAVWARPAVAAAPAALNTSTRAMHPIKEEGEVKKYEMVLCDIHDAAVDAGLKRQELLRRIARADKWCNRIELYGGVFLCNGLDTIREMLTDVSDDAKKLGLADDVEITEAVDRVLAKKFQIAFDNELL